MASQEIVAKHRELVTSGPLLKAVITLAWPPVVGMLMEVALSVINFFWVGRLGPSAQDSVTTSMVVIWTVFSIASIISIGVTAFVSRHVGAGEPEKAAHYVSQALRLALAIGAVVSVAGFFAAPAFLELMNAADATRAHALSYLRVFFATSLLLYLVETAYAAFRASGDTRTPTKVGVTMVAVNMALDPLLIFGLGPIPALGVPGAALATAIAYLCGVVLIFRPLLRGRLGYRVEGVWRDRLAPASMGKMIRVGLPIASQQFVFVMVYWFLIGFVHEFGESAGAAMGIGNRMESFSYLTCCGFAIAASTLVGQNLGAGQPERAARAAWSAAGFGVAITLLFGATLLLLPRTIAGVFTNDATVLGIAADYLIILGLSQFAMAIEIILEGAFSGAGDTLPPLLVMLPGSLARIPLAYYLAFHLGWGVNGIWWTLTITTTLKALVLAYWFKLGHWQHKKL